MREVTIHFMCYEPVVRKMWQAKFDLDYRDWNAIFYIAWLDESQGYFSKADFDDYDTIHNWKPGRTQSYIDKGWVQLWFDAKRKKGQTSKWKLTREGRLMISEFYNYLVGAVPIPQTKRFNKLMKDKYKVPAIKKMASDSEFLKRWDENNDDW